MFFIFIFLPNPENYTRQSLEKYNSYIFNALTVVKFQSSSLFLTWTLPHLSIFAYKYIDIILGLRFACFDVENMGIFNFSFLFISSDVKFHFFLFLILTFHLWWKSMLNSVWPNNIMYGMMLTEANRTCNMIASKYRIRDKINHANIRS